MSDVRDKENFFQDVYEVVRLVPYGRVTSYGAIANYLGVKRSARAVGWAMRASVGVEDVPAHRVLNRVGMLSGKAAFGSPSRMRELLEQEGVVVKDDQVVHWDRYFWDPMQELGLD